MLVHKIFLNAGQIESREELQLEEMDHALFNQAEQALSVLRAGRNSVSASLAEGLKIPVTLRLSLNEYSENRMRHAKNRPIFSIVEKTGRFCVSEVFTSD
jgi:hypothetical protein